jgi:hypothetical protein
MPDPHKETSGPISSGLTDDQGHYSLMCSDGRPGAIVGWHKIVLTDISGSSHRIARRARMDSDADLKLPEAEKAAPSQVPAKYTQSGMTPLSKEVKPGKQEISIDLTG